MTDKYTTTELMKKTKVELMDYITTTLYNALDTKEWVNELLSARLNKCYSYLKATGMSDEEFKRITRVDEEDY